MLGLLEQLERVNETRQKEVDGRSVGRSMGEKIVLRAQEEVECMGFKPQLERLAPFHVNELSVGNHLGTGGFANVFEITALHEQRHNDENNNRHQSSYSPHQIQARKNMMDRSSSPSHRIFGILNPFQGRNNNKPFVAKVLREDLVRNNPRKFADGAVDLVREAAFLSVLDHPHIIRVHAMSCAGPEGFATGDHDGFFLLLDRLEETLQDRIHTWRKQFKKLKNNKKREGFRRRNKRREERRANQLNKLLLERIKVAHDIASAMDYLHSQNIIFRDLKPSNIGFDAKGVVKVFDLGLCREIPDQDVVCEESSDSNEENLYNMSSVVGTYRYMAPEVRKKRERYNLKADVYSFATVLSEILSLDKPDGSKRMCHCCWPEPIRDLLARAWSVNIAERPTMSEIRSILRIQIKDLSDDNDDEEEDSLATVPHRPAPRRSILREMVILPNNKSRKGGGVWSNDTTTTAPSISGTSISSCSATTTTRPVLLIQES